MGVDDNPLSAYLPQPVGREVLDRNPLLAVPAVQLRSRRRELVLRLSGLVGQALVIQLSAHTLHELEELEREELDPEARRSMEELNAEGEALEAEVRAIDDELVARGLRP